MRAVRKNWSDDTWQPLLISSVAERTARRGESDRWWLLVRDKGDAPNLGLRRVTSAESIGAQPNAWGTLREYMEGGGQAGARLCGSP